ncbi:MAG: AmmeMemoRadiSam system protein B [Candidatus Omnitrophica bacterium]|nr:AmmeMemoRadiSam system protein B [Candidatus Omnitrophota bacterium]
MAQNYLRNPVVAGQFYPSNKRDLNAMISSFEDRRAVKKDVIGAILPHAGYLYSGKVATETISGINIKDNLILLGTNHTGLGADFSIIPKGTWKTPLGNVDINDKLAGLFLNRSELLEVDITAHQDEHSLEVELPILQYFRNDFRIVPIAIKSFNLLSLKELAEGLADVIKKNSLRESVLFIASSDLNHYEPQEISKKKDSLAIEAIVALDEDRLEIVIRDSDISMCGFAPVAVLIKTAKLLGAKGAQLIKYQTSGQVNNDMNSVVGYAGITIY